MKIWIIIVNGRFHLFNYINMGYSIPYLFLLFILFLLYLNEARRLRWINLQSIPKIVVILLLLFLGFRGHIYSDFISYYPYFEELPNIFSIKITEYNFEPGFVFYTSLLKTIIPNYFVWIIINTLIDLLVLSWFFKKYSSSFVLPFLFFIIYSGLIMEFNLYRTMKGLDCFLLSVPFLLNRKFIPFLVLNILGATFHSSSLLYIPLYFVLCRQFPRTIIYGSIIFVNCLYILKVGIIASFLGYFTSYIEGLDNVSKVISHFNNNEVSNVLGLRHLERTFIILLLTYYLPLLIKHRKSNLLFYNCCLVYYLSICLFYEVKVFADRFPLLFVFGFWILLPNLLELKIKIKKFIIAIITMLGIYIVYINTCREDAKYENIIWGISSYEQRRDVIIRELDINYNNLKRRQ